MYNINKYNRIIWQTFLLILCYLSSNNAQSPTIAVMPLESSSISISETRTLTNRLNTELIQIGKYTVVEQTKINELFKQKGLNEPGNCATIECRIEIGKSLGAQYIVIGSIGSIGRTFTFDCHRIDVFSGKTMQTIIYDAQGNIDDMLDLIRLVALELSGKTPEKDQLKSLKKIKSSHQFNHRYTSDVKYHIGGSFFYAVTRSDDFIPPGLRFLYHKHRYSLGIFCGRVVDYGNEWIDTRYENVNLEFHEMNFAEISFDYHLTRNKPVSAFVGMAVAYTNPMRSEWSRQPEPPWDSVYHNKRKSKIGIHPQIGCYLRRDYAISSRIAFGLVSFPAEKEGLNHSGITFEISLLLNF